MRDRGGSYYNCRQIKSQLCYTHSGTLWRGGENNERELRKSYYNSLRLAVENKVERIAFPNISTGVYRFPKDLAAEIAINEVINFLQNDVSIVEVIFVCFDDENYKIYSEYMNKILM